MLFMEVYMAENELLNNEMEEMDEPEIITLVDMDGKDVEFYHLATLDYKQEWYIILQPVDKLPDIADDEVLIYKLGVDKEDGTDTFEPVEDEEVLQAVFDEYIKACEEDECCNCEECDCEDCDCEETDCKCSCDKD